MEAFWASVNGFLGVDLSKLLPTMLEGSKVTLSIFILTLLFSLPLGLLISMGRMTRLKIIQYPVRFFLLVARGTPLILQIMFVYFAPFYIVGFTLDRFWAVILAFTLNYAAYFAEIYRSGIESMSQGQYEAAGALGFTKAQTFFRIILPQVCKRIVPPMGNEFMTLVKDTALAQTVAVLELFSTAKSASSSFFSTVPLVVAGIFYLIMNAIVSKAFSLVEKHFDYYQ